MFNPFLTTAFLRTAWLLTTPDGALVPVTFRSRQAPGATFTDYSLSHVKRRPGESLRNGDPALAGRTLSWLLWKDDLDAASGPAPKPNDLIVDAAGVSWAIDTMDLHLFGCVYHCQSTKARTTAP